VPGPVASAQAARACVKLKRESGGIGPVHVGAEDLHEAGFRPSRRCWRSSRVSVWRMDRRSPARKGRVLTHHSAVGPHYNIKEEVTP
jgi:hypothetical protein